MNNLRILVTGAGAIVAPSIIKNYKVVDERDIYVVGVDIKPIVCNKYIDKYYQYRKPTDKDYIETLLNICIKEKINFVIPLVDSELLILSKNKELFKKNNIIICINEPDKIELVQNKYNLYKYLEEKNVGVPRSIKFNNIEELIAASKQITGIKCYKPVISSGSRGFKIIKDDIDYDEYLFGSKADSKYISMDYLIKSMKKCKNIPQMMLMEYVSGDLYNVNVLANNGQTLYAVSGKVLDFGLGNTTKCKIENNIEVLDFCKKITKLLKLNGNIGFEVAYTNANKLKLIEINIRVQGQIYSSTLAGVNFPYLELKYYLGEELPKYDIREITMIRYFEDIELID